MTGIVCRMTGIVSRRSFCKMPQSDFLSRGQTYGSSSVSKTVAGPTFEGVKVAEFVYALYLL